MSASARRSENAATCNAACGQWSAKDGHTEALGIEIRESNPPDAALDLQRQVAEQMLFGALRERGIADDAEAARRRAAFLAEAGRLLAESVDQSTTLVALTRLALPTLGAWCIVDISRRGQCHPSPCHLPPRSREAKARRGAGSELAPNPTIRSAPRRCCGTRERSPSPDDIDATLAASAHSPAQPSDPASARDRISPHGSARCAEEAARCHHVRQRANRSSAQPGGCPSG